jgi:hypothetical protein
VAAQIDQHVRATMTRMSLPEKIGQLFVTYVDGDLRRRPVDHDRHRPGLPRELRFSSGAC